MQRCVIVVPCYNEAARLDPAMFLQYANSHPDTVFLMVNDGSTDNTLVVLQRLSQSNDRSFRVLDLGTNGGKATAVRHGILRALDSGADFVGYWDADLATPLDEIPRLMSALQADDTLLLAMGSRVRLLGHQIDRHLGRRILGRCFAAAASLVIKLPLHDTQCGAKIFRASPAIRRIFALPFRTNWIFDVELLVRLKGDQSTAVNGISHCVREVPLRAWRDVPGSKLRLVDFLRSLFELVFLACSYQPPTRAAMRDTPSHDSSHNLRSPVSCHETERAA